MASILFKWFFTAGLCMLFTNSAIHPIYVSVIEIEHNGKGKTLEVSCKLFTDDFEKALRSTYKTSVDLINPKDRPAMDKLINEYVQKHLKITADNKPVLLKYLGYEQVEEGIYSYYEAANIAQVKDIVVVNNLLYEFKPEQMGLIHITVNGNRKSTKLNNPNDRAVVNF
jgi:hypothetical protein